MFVWQFLLEDSNQITKMGIIIQFCICITTYVSIPTVMNMLASINEQNLRLLDNLIAERARFVSEEENLKLGVKNC